MKPFQRTMARRTAMQAIYQWQMTGDLPSAIKAQFSSDPECKNVDWDYFDRIFDGVVAEHEELDSLYKRFLEKRSSEDLDQVDRAILRVGCYELLRLSSEVPYKVVINEAVNLAKAFAAEESHRFINGVLDKVVSKGLHLKDAEPDEDADHADESNSEKKEPETESAAEGSAAEETPSADGTEAAVEDGGKPKPMSLDPSSPGRRRKPHSFSGRDTGNGRNGGKSSFRHHSDSSFRKGHFHSDRNDGEDGGHSDSERGERHDFRKDRRPHGDHRPSGERRSGPWKSRAPGKEHSGESAE